MSEQKKFNRAKAESDLHDVMFELDIGAWSATSDVEGVAVYVCDDRFDEDAIRRGLEARGHVVEQVTSCTWEMEDGSDEDVVAVAFDVPGLPDEWRVEQPATPGQP